MYTATLYPKWVKEKEPREIELKDPLPLSPLPLSPQIFQRECAVPNKPSNVNVSLQTQLKDPHHPTIQAHVTVYCVGCTLKQQRQQDRRIEVRKANMSILAPISF